MTCPVCHANMVAHARYCGGCGAAIAPTKSAQFPAQAQVDMIGKEIVGRYRISAKLGEGGMGAVYLAEQISLKRTVALKVLKPEMSVNRDLVRRFNAEAELAAKLNHPHTVTLFDFGQDEAGTLFIAMECIEGRSLREALVHEGPFPLQRIVSIASQICSSLSDAHSHGIIHRDLKPDNVMLSKRGRKVDQVTVLDFGIAKLRGLEGDITQQAMTQVGDMLGTPQYMAPEQIRGGDIDARTDIYALGVLLYEMTTARMPFDGKTIMELLSKHLTETPIAPVLRRPELSIHPGLSELIMQCLEKSLDDRPKTMDDVEEQLLSLASMQALPTAQQTEAPAPQWAATSPVAATVMATSASAGVLQPVVHTAPQPVTPNPDSGRQEAPAYALPTAQQAGRTTDAGQHTLTTRPKSKSIWLVPTLLILLAAGGAALYYTVLRPSEEHQDDTVASPEHKQHQEEPRGTGFRYVDSAYGYTIQVPPGFTGSGDSDGLATFVGTVAGEPQTIAAKAWKGNKYYSETEIQNELTTFLPGMGFSVKNSKWESFQELRVLHGEAIAANAYGEFMLAHEGSTYFFVIVSGPQIPSKEIKSFRSALLSKHIHPPHGF